MIIYYSGTGNSRFAAQAAADYLQDELVDTHAYLRGHQAGNYHSDQAYVFCAPTYAWRLPIILSDFIQASQFTGSKDAYFLMTCGDDVGNAASYLAKLCQDKGLKFRGLLPVVMPENYIALFTVPDQTESQAIIQAALPGLKQGLERIAQGQVLPTRSGSFADRVKSGPVNVLFRKFLVKARAFRVTDACITCGRCAQTCVTNNITMQAQRPVWGNACIHCMDCICGCPVAAIEYGKKSVGQPRYTCPPYAGELEKKEA